VRAITAADVLSDAFGRIRDGVHRLLEGFPVDQLEFRPDSEANSVAWLVWHLTRIQDDHVAGVAQSKQIWTSKGWCERFALPLDSSDTGYGHRAGEVAVVRSTPELLLGYHDAVYEYTMGFLSGLKDSEYDRVVDTKWDPPVTLLVRLVSVVADDLEHLGQAEYIRGLVERL